LTLSRDAVNALSLQSAGDAQLTLADGQAVTLELFLANIIWHGQPRDVVAIQTEDETLIGMALLEGNRLTIDAWDGGNVTVEKVN
jgi:predicted aspartyl protease